MKILPLNILFILISFQLFLFPQANSLKFSHLTINDGLSNKTVTSIFQDSKGYIWIGTMDGLNKYDGYNFSVYRYEHGSSNSLSDYAINAIEEDDSGILWIATREGLNSFDPETETFKFYTHNTEDNNSISHNFITDLFCNDNILWIGTRNGLNKLNLKTNKFAIFKNDPSKANSLSHNFINDIEPDNDNILWIATLGGGLNKFNIKDNSFQVFKNNPDDENSISHNNITTIKQDSQNRLWIGSIRGLDLLDINRNKIIRFRNSDDLNSISNNHVRSINEDKNNNILIATLGGGFNILNPETGKFLRYNYDTKNLNSICSDFLRTIYIDKSGIIWIGTEDKGISKFSKGSQKFSHIKYDNTLVSGSNSVLSFFKDSENDFWLGTESGLKQINNTSFSMQKNFLDKKPVTSITEVNNKLFIGTFGEGLFLIDKEKNTSIKFSDKFGISSSFIHTFFKDKEGIIWIGTGLRGLIKYNPDTDDYKIYQHDQDNINSLSTVEVTSIAEDEEGFLWIGTTTGGLNKFDKKKEVFYHYKPDPKNINSLNSMRINTLYLDSKANLWIGTFGGGLNKFDRKNSFSHYTAQNGLASNIVVGIVEDKKGNLWLSTTKGISRFNPEDNSFKNYDISDGLQENEFLNNSFYHDSKNDLIFFGGINGFNYFHPDSIREDTFISPVLITDFKIFNNSVPIRNYEKGEKSPLEKHISYTDEIILSHNNNAISFDFVSLHFANPAKNKYAYKLEGFDKEWIYSGNLHTASYTNLDPGSYIFKVKGTNSDGLWNEKETSIKLLINPPWWKTWWAYSIYAILFISLLLFARSYEMNRIKLKHNLERKEFEAKKLNEIDHMKSRFFANISHEFRTPLTLILGISEKYIKNYKDNLSDFKIIKKSAQRLLQLINQLLELSKLESGNINLQVRETDLSLFIKRIASSFISLAEHKNIEFKLNGMQLSSQSFSEGIFIYFDHDKMETIIYNLLSNAFKFTPEGEKINIEIDSDKKNATVKIINTGIIISEKHMPFIFDRFYQADDSETRGFEGTGIGLALVKELVELHKGEVKINTFQENETVFTLTFLLGKNHFSENQIISTEEKISEKIHEENDNIFIESDTDKIKDIRTDNGIILVVEDNFDLRNFINEQLESEYSVIEAEDGEKGLKMADEIIPDLIISDIMMPKKNGYQLCKEIKTNIKINHIPVILLTAKATLEDKLEGLELGADDYLIKPFNTNELKTRVKNLINIRQKMREKFQSEMILKPAEVLVPSNQKKFIESFIKIIEEHIEDENFSVEVLCREIGISRSQLHRKIKAVTNQSTSEFIRTFRLQRAAELIKKSAGNMAEIAYKVGFNSQAYFTKSFQEVYGCTPTDFKNKTSANPENLAHDKNL